MTVTVPTVYLFGEADPAFARRSALATASFVSGPYRYVPLPGIGHWLTEQASDTVTAELLALLERRPWAHGSTPSFASMVTALSLPGLSSSDLR
ncbi:MAG: alpha/beta hydrolase [Gemmatimonadales bacterium]